MAELRSTAIPMVMEFLSSHDLLARAALVCSEWHRLANAAYSWRAAQADVENEDGDSDDEEHPAVALSSAARRRGRHRVPVEYADGSRVGALHLSVPLVQAWRSMLRAFPWGRYLSDGAYKRVFQVWSRARSRMEAVAVMDIGALAESGHFDVVRREVHCACLLTQLVRTRVCPNVVELYQVFVHRHAPPTALWGTADEPLPQGPFEAARHVIEGILPPEAPRDHSDEEDPQEGKRRGSVRTRGRGRSAKTAGGRGGRATGKTRGQVAAATPLPRVETVPEPPASERGAYQFLRMELCSGGDLEADLRRIECSILEAEEVERVAASISRGLAVDEPKPARTPSRARRAATASKARGRAGKDAPTTAEPLAVLSASSSARGSLLEQPPLVVDSVQGENLRQRFFQMCFSIYAARERLGFRHYDIKLLNFLLKPAAAVAEEVRGAGLGERRTGSAAETAGRPRSLHVRYSLGTLQFVCRLSCTDDFLVKLADYGTADTRDWTFGRPVKPQHFTTLENTPPEFLLLGDAARQVRSPRLDACILLCSLLSPALSSRESPV